MTENVHYTSDGAVATIRLDDGKANALGIEVLEGLLAGFDRAEQEGAAVLFTGRRVLAFPRPVVAAAPGHAMAAGAFLLLAADLRLGAAGAFRIGLNETRIGLTLPWFVVELARHRVPPARLDEAVVAATVYSPEGAVGAGYLDRVVEPEAVDEAARSAVAELAALDARAYADNKARVRGPAIDRVREAAARTSAELAAALREHADGAR